MTQKKRSSIKIEKPTEFWLDLRKNSATLG